MKYFLPLIVLLLYTAGLQAQDNSCSALFRQHSGRPFPFQDRLGRGKQFGELLQRYRCNSVPDFVDILKSPDTWNRKSDGPLRAEMNCILRGIGLSNGIADLNASQVALTYIPYGTVGNLGSWSHKTRTMKYLFVALFPAGEPSEGVRAYQITGPGGKSVYICTTCGNAFFPRKEPCCLDVKIQHQEDSATFDFKPAAHDRPLYIYGYRVCAATTGKRKQAQQQGDPHKKRNVLRRDTTLAYVDSSIWISVPAGGRYRVRARTGDTVVRVCDGQPVPLHATLAATPIDTPALDDGPIKYTWYVPCTDSARTRWEFVLGAGISGNSIPRYTGSTVHTRTDKTHFAAELLVGYGISNHLQVGLLAAYQTVSYQDDAGYAGSLPNTYNRVTAGKLVPLQAFLKWSDGNRKLQTSVALFCGYAVAFKDRIENDNGLELPVRPGTSGGLSAGARAGVACFISERVGVGLAVTGQYTSLNNNLIQYKSGVMPATLTLHYRLP